MFVAYEVTLQLVRELRPIVQALSAHDRALVDQIMRAGSSVLLNLGEGNGRSGKDRKRFFQYAKGSVSEIKAVIDLAEAWGWDIDTRAARSIVGRLDALLWGLIR